MTNSEYIVERIPAIITERTSSICDENKLKVAAYCRVSTGEKSSYQATLINQDLYGIDNIQK